MDNARIREAILKAADHIERNPQEFNFNSVDFPDRCGTPGCALGWIGHFLGLSEPEASRMTGHYSPTLAIAMILGTRAVDHACCEFYDLMHDLAPRWRDAASECATALRLYADKYHPAALKADPVPAAVRAIFDMTPEQLRAAMEAA